MDMIAETTLFGAYVRFSRICLRFETMRKEGNERKQRIMVQRHAHVVALRQNF